MYGIPGLMVSMAKWLTRHEKASWVFSSTAHKVGKKGKTNQMPGIEPETYTLSQSFSHRATLPGNNDSPFLSL